MPGEPSANREHMSSMNDATRSQNDMLLSLGNAISGAPIIRGTIQLPNPPIIAGITMKKIMMMAWLLKNTLYMFLAASIDPSPLIIHEISGNTCIPGSISSARMMIEIVGGEVDGRHG